VLSSACVAVAAAVAILAGNAPAWSQQKLAAPPNPQIERGRQLFAHKWTKNDPLSPHGDGLGPMFNANSCAACHSQGGMGGSGSVAHNVQLLTVVRPHAGKEQPADFRKDFVERIVKLNSNFLTSDGVQSSVVFHRFGEGDDYQQWRESFWGVAPALNGPQRGVALKLAQRKTAGKPMSKLAGMDGVEFVLSERNTPALFGAGLLNEISTEVLEDVAKHQAEIYPGLAGRVGRTGDFLRNVGRFGWRGQVDELDDFIDTACAVELGLEVPFHKQTGNPRLKADHRVPENFDLEKDQLEDLFEYVNSLPRPVQIVPKEPQLAAMFNVGESMFHSVGCTACHMPKLGDVAGVYSDLLLHDMGPDLADPVPAVPALKVISSMTSSGGAYGGGSFDVFADIPSNIRREWRTPPLWGVADSAPYLHDGRAATLEQAILLHGGEGQSSAGRYASLPSDSKNAILLFLSTLRAPGVGGRGA